MLVADQRIAGQLLPPRNGLNVVRLILAVMVVVGHAWLLGGYEHAPTLGRYGIGPFAVAGFFGISGYLIAKSRQRTSTSRYFWHRALRIFPGLWAVLLVTALVIAPATWLMGHDTISGFPWAAGAGYFARNSTMFLPGLTGIHGTLTTAATSYWNGSLWTLGYEFSCYIALAVLVSIGLVRRRWPIMAITVACGILIATGIAPGGAHSIGAINLGTLMAFFVPFGAGMTLAVYEGRVRMNIWAALACAVVVGVVLATMSNPVPAMAFPLAYLLLWVGCVLPAGPFLRTDLSYGVYIYGYPVQQLIARTDASRHGPWIYLLTTLPVVLLLAWASWRIVESRALRLKDWTPVLPRVRVGANRPDIVIADGD